MVIVLLIIVNLLICFRKHGLIGGLLQMAGDLTILATTTIAVLCPPLGIPLTIVAFFVVSSKFREYNRRQRAKYGL
jgi:hypothetical protein